MGLRLYNGQHELGEDAEVVELLGRTAAILNGESDPIFADEDAELNG